MKGRLVSSVVFLSILTGAAAFAKSAKESTGTNVDSGTFGVFMNGRRVGTETFSITQNSNGSVITSRWLSGSASISTATTECARAAR